MKSFTAVLFVAAMIWSSNAAPTATTKATALPTFEEVVAQAQNSFKTMSEHVNEILGLPKNADASNVLEAVKSNTENWTKEVSGLVEKIKKQVDAAKTGEVSDTLKSVQEKLEKTVESLKKEIESPEVKAKSKQIQESFTKSLNVIVDEANKLSKTVVADKSISADLEKLSKQVVEKASKAAETFAQSLHEASAHAKDQAKH